MTTIGLIGMGKMGKAIAGLLDSKTDTQYKPFFRVLPEQTNELQSCDVIIEFTQPDVAPGIIRQCLELQLPVVSGTTGWHEYHLENIKTLCRQLQGKFIYATNFSIGMNIVFALNRKLAAVMQRWPEFAPSLKEIHHIHKKDAPSGTAYTLLEDIVQAHPELNGFVLNPVSDTYHDKKIPVTAIREGEVKGYHEVIWSSNGERISLVHEAKDRSIFASGAIMASQWLLQQPPGIYTMRDIIHL